MTNLHIPEIKDSKTKSFKFLYSNIVSPLCAEKMDAANTLGILISASCREQTGLDRNYYKERVQKPKLSFNYISMQTTNRVEKLEIQINRDLHLKNLNKPNQRTNVTKILNFIKTGWTTGSIRGWYNSLSTMEVQASTTNFIRVFYLFLLLHNHNTIIARLSAE